MTELLAKSETADALAAKVRTNDSSAFSDLYTLMVGPLERYLVPLTGSKELAMDVIHDIFVRFWENRSQIVIRYSTRAFLYTMARNRALNLKKRANRLVTTDFGDWYSILEAPSSEASLADREFAESITEWISELPPRRSEAFMLSRYHGLSHKQIGRIMNLSERTVDTHVQHALRDLRGRIIRNEATL